MIRGIILDLDGTVYHGDSEVPGASGFVRRAADQGRRCLFVTNRASRTPGEIAAHLRDYNIPCEPGDVLTSAEATARHLGGGRVYCIGGQGLRQALMNAGFTVTADSPDHVVVSFDTGFDYEKLATAARLIRGGARYVATNPDKALVTDQGLMPGTGSIVAAVTTACGVEPLIVGKPERLIFDIAVARLGLPKEEVVAVGDNLETDIPAGHRAGIRTVLLLTGVSSREDLAGAPVQPTWVAENFREVEQIVMEDTPA
jgi:4-nitrophenyl phosphatase